MQLYRPTYLSNRGTVSLATTESFTSPLQDLRTNHNLMPSHLYRIGLNRGKPMRGG
ncbi:hypothetical protein O3M35_011739 [Rhynocoris fuscipes]|uniref:Uncharacterized protein n=1 Tax=Rhynocoris fuscipes TaxID=488301 RepID=A0AAW1CWB5_9HEMI